MFTHTSTHTNTRARTHPPPHTRTTMCACRKRDLHEAQRLQSPHQAQPHVRRSGRLVPSTRALLQCAQLDEGNGNRRDQVKEKVPLHIPPADGPPIVVIFGTSPRTLSQAAHVEVQNNIEREKDVDEHVHLQRRHLNTRRVQPVESDDWGRDNGRVCQQNCRHDQPKDAKRREGEHQFRGWNQAIVWADAENPLFEGPALIFHLLQGTLMVVLLNARKILRCCYSSLAFQLAARQLFPSAKDLPFFFHQVALMTCMTEPRRVSHCSGSRTCSQFLKRFSGRFL